MSPTSVPPPILILTSSPIETEDFNSTLEEIARRKLKVDVVTFARVESPKLLKLTRFGSLYASKSKEPPEDDLLKKVDWLSN